MNLGIYTVLSKAVYSHLIVNGSMPVLGVVVIPS